MSENNVVELKKKSPKEQLCENLFWLGYWSAMGRLDKECCDNILKLQDEWSNHIMTDDSLIFSDEIMKGIKRGEKGAEG